MNDKESKKSSFFSVKDLCYIIFIFVTLFIAVCIKLLLYQERRSYKNLCTFLPILLIPALSILLVGCFVVPTDESSGYTPGTITGIIAAPYCTTSSEVVSEPCCISPEYWCYYCEKEWKLQDNVEVILTYGEDEVATVFTNQYGEFIFTNVSPGKNYVITAYCPDYDDDRPLVKDVALELVEGGSFDTKITDLVSTSLGLVVDFLVDFTILGPEDIVLDDVIADKPDFPNFPKFKKLVIGVLRVLEACQNVNADDDLQSALCRAAEEISGPDIGCGQGNTPPLVIRYTLTTVVDPAGSGTVTGGGTYNAGATATVNASPNAGYVFDHWSGDLSGSTNPTTILMNSNKSVTAHFVEEDPCRDNEHPSISIDDQTINAGDSLSYAPGDAGYTASDDNTNGVPSHALSNEPTGMSINSSTGEITCTTACGDAGTYSDIEVTITDACGLSASDTFNLIVVECCESADLSSFSLEIQEGSSWNEYLGDIYPFESGQKEYYVMTAKNASHFRFTVTTECENSSTLEYNWYRGQCGDSWLTGESGYSDPPLTWIPITSGGTYPTDTNDRSVCHKGGNVLFIKVTNAVNTEIYKVYVE